MTIDVLFVAMFVFTKPTIHPLFQSL